MARGVPGEAQVVAVAVIEDPGETEVEDFRVPRGQDHHVLGFEISVDDPPGVGGGKTIGDLPPVVEHEAGVEGAVFHQGGEIGSVDHFP